MLEELLEASNKEFNSSIVREKTLALGMFGLVLYPTSSGITGLAAASLFVTHENTMINSSAAILAEIAMSLNHCRRTGKGTMICVQLGRWKCL